MKFVIFCETALFLVLIELRKSRQSILEHHHDNRDGVRVVTESERNIWKVAANSYKGANKPELENVIFSPLSLTSSMVMLSAGAEGETAREIQTLFQLGNNSQFSVKNQTEVLNSLTNQALEKEADVTIMSASRIYANKENAKLRENYVESVKQLGDVETLDFTEPKPVVETINEWVRNKTEGKISEIVEEKDFDKEASAVLVNTLYFKAPWKHQFDKKYTETADFHVSDNKKVPVEMMYISAEFPKAELTQYGATAIFLPYKGDRFNMIVYLPQNHDKLSTLEEKLETLNPTEIRNEATTSEISVCLPKFNMSSSLDFKPILTSLGVQKMFKSEEADFSGMSESAGFHVSKVRQSVFIEVDEEGTEAAAVTDVHGLVGVSLPRTIRVNRPFIFQIYDQVTGAVLLSGRISNPSSNGSEEMGLVSESVDDSASNTGNIFIALFTTLVIVLILVLGVIFFLGRRRIYERKSESLQPLESEPALS